MMLFLFFIGKKRSSHRFSKPPSIVPTSESKHQYWERGRPVRSKNGASPPNPLPLLGGGTRLVVPCDVVP